MAAGGDWDMTEEDLALWNKYSAKNNKLDFIIAYGNSESNPVIVEGGKLEEGEGPEDLFNRLKPKLIAYAEEDGTKGAVPEKHWLKVKRKVFKKKCPYLFMKLSGENVVFKYVPDTLKPQIKMNSTLVEKKLLPQVEGKLAADLCHITDIGDLVWGEILEELLTGPKANNLRRLVKGE